MNLTREIFFELEARLRAANFDSDNDSFDRIRERLSRREPLDADEFAEQAIYVVLAGGFSQKTAKRIHADIMKYLVGAQHVAPNRADGATRRADYHPPLRSSEQMFDDLIRMFRNQNKINAVIRIWKNRIAYRDGYYAIDCPPTDGRDAPVGSPQRGSNSRKLMTPPLGGVAEPRRGDAVGGQSILEEKLLYLSNLPHIGKITANHLARNLGEDIVKYDVWIKRLGVAFVESVGAHSCAPKNRDVKTGRKNTPLRDKINDAKLDPGVRAACDAMFAHLVVETGLPRGYIDVVLWKACQNGLIKL